MKAVDVLSAVLVLVGALNWGLVGIANFNLVAALFGDSILSSIVYVLVGISAAYQIGRWATLSKPALATA